LNTESRKIDLTNDGNGIDAAVKFVNRRIWLPKFLYDLLPWFYLAAGITALLATLYVSQWFWILPHYLLFSAGCIHIGIIIVRRRQSSNTHPRT